MPGVPGDFDTFQTARATAAAIRAREVSPVEVLDACLARVDAVDDRLNAVIWRNDDEARRAARAAADAVVNSSPEELPPFLGVPIPIKDLTAVAGWPVTYGSWSADAAPSETSELVVQAFQKAGFVLTGRTNTAEFGALTVAENDRYGITRNPWDPDRTPGGSSGGASAAVTGGLFPIAHGNDGAGSIRIPASCAGLVGLKVSRGRVARMVTAWEGAAVQGALTRDVADTAAVLDVISEPDRLQWYNAPPPERPFLSEVGADPGRLRVGLLTEAPFGLEVDQACIEAAREAAAALEKLGHYVDIVGYEVPPDFLVAFLNVVNSGLADFDVDWERTGPISRPPAWPLRPLTASLMSGRCTTWSAGAAGSSPAGGTTSTSSSPRLWLSSRRGRARSWLPPMRPKRSPCRRSRWGPSALGSTSAASRPSRCPPMSPPAGCR